MPVFTDRGDAVAGQDAGGLRVEAGQGETSLVHRTAAVSCGLVGPWLGEVPPVAAKERGPPAG